MKISRPTVAAVYFPAWHAYDHMDAWKGIGWNEWTLVRDAKPRFKGHYQPIKPTWGFFDEANPKWSAREIDLAADHGVDVFMFDWYWYNGVRVMEEALERGFLKAKNRRRIKFGLMWANHNWGDYFPAPTTGWDSWNRWLPMRHSEKDLLRAIDYCAEHYFSQPNYWRMADGGLFFSVFDGALFVNQLGGPEKMRRLLKKVDSRLHARGLPSIHWNVMTYDIKAAPRFKSAGFTSISSYNVNSPGESFNVTPTGRKQAAGAKQVLVDYEELIGAHHDNWTALEKSKMAYFPVTTLGWDCTPRCLKSEKWPFPKKIGYPYTHVVVGNTPRRFKKLCAGAKGHLAPIQKRDECRHDQRVERMDRGLLPPAGKTIRQRLSQGRARGFR